VWPYGVDQYPEPRAPSDPFEKEGFIFVNQDARGRYMSKGEFQQVRPYVPQKRGPQDIDESTDTYDTIECERPDAMQYSNVFTVRVK
jgi:predicted acyl esterase